MEIVVLRWGHRLRDERITTHIALTARALGASGMILSDIEDRDINYSIDKIVKQWGGSFYLKMNMPWKKVIEEWKKKEGVVVHLTAYGENIETNDVLERIKNTNKDVLILIGSQKVPSQFFSEKVSDFNVSIGNQPHSECSALAIFLDRFFKGKELEKTFDNAKIKIIPNPRRKKVIKMSNLT